MKEIIKKSPRMLLLEEEYKKPIEELLRYYYVDLGMSIHEVSKEINVDFPRVHYWLKKAGIYSHKLKIK